MKALRPSDSAVFLRRLSRLLPLLVLLVTFSISYLLWQQREEVFQRNLQANFDFRVRETADHIDQRMLTYELALRSVGALFDSSVSVSRDEYQTFFRGLNIEKNYPGILGIGFSLIVLPKEKISHTASLRRQGFSQYAIWPEGKRDLYSAVIHIAPFSGSNLQALGFDMYAEPVRRAAMDRARDSGDVAISAKAQMFKIAGKPQLGFLMYLPIYRQSLPHNTVAERRANILGWVYAPFRIDDLMYAINGEHSNDLDIEIYDGEQVAQQALMYDSNTFVSQQITACNMTRRIEIAGHPWMLRVRSTPEYEHRHDHDGPEIIAGSGVILGVLLALLTWQLIGGRSRALALASKMNRELIESEARFRSMADSAPVLIWMTGDGKLPVWFNKVWLDFSGRKIDDSNFYGWADGIHPDDLQACVDCFGSHHEGREAFRLEYRRRRYDGQYRYLVDSAVPRIDDKGNFLGFIGSAIDISERRAAEEEVHRFNRALRLLSACNAALIHAQEEGTLLEDICRLIVETGGYRMAWVGFAMQDEGKKVQAVAQYGFAMGYLDNTNISWADSEHGQGVTGRAIRCGDAVINRDFSTNADMAPWRESALQHGYQSSIALPLKDGEKVFGALTIYCAETDSFNADEVKLLREMANDLAFGVVLLRMIAERNRSAVALRESEQKFRTLAENSPSIILRYDLYCRRTFANAAFERESGIPLSRAPHENIGQNWNLNIPVEEFKSTLRRVMQTQQAEQLFFEAMHPQRGEVSSYALHLVPEYAVGGEVSGILAIGHNITALKEAERRLEESHSQLRELTLRREEAREDERKSIARDLHDDLGQLLTALRMSIGLLLLKFGENRPRLAQEITQLKSHVDSIIQVVRNVASRLRPAVLDMGIVSALEWLVDEFSKQNGDVYCELNISGEVGDLDGDYATAIFRIVQESLTNVARHAQAGRVDIMLDRRGDTCFLEVTDDGVGFDLSKRKNKSFGLIGVRERVLMLGGELSFFSEPGKGTTLKVEMPVKSMRGEM